MSAGAITLRRYTAADEDAAIALWQRTWQATYPDIDFAARVPWWRDRWRNELVAHAEVVVAERRIMNDVAERRTVGNLSEHGKPAEGAAMVGFVTVDPATGYLDQIVVAPEAWGGDVATVLLAEARRISPLRLDLHVNTDNIRAIGFYRKHGFVPAGNDINPVSGRPVSKMSWRA